MGGRLLTLLAISALVGGCDPPSPEPRPAIGCQDITRADSVYYLVQDGELSGACVQLELGPTVPGSPLAGIESTGPLMLTGGYRYPVPCGSMRPDFARTTYPLSPLEGASGRTDAVADGDDATLSVNLDLEFGAAPDGSIPAGAEGVVASEVVVSTPCGLL